MRLWLKNYLIKNILYKKVFQFISCEIEIQLLNKCKIWAIQMKKRKNICKTKIRSKQETVERLNKLHTTFQKLLTHFREKIIPSQIFWKKSHSTFCTWILKESWASQDTSMVLQNSISKSHILALTHYRVDEMTSILWIGGDFDSGVPPSRYL